MPFRWCGFFFIQTIRFTKECRCSAGTCKAAFIWLTFGKQFNILCPFYNFQPSKLKKLYYDCMKPLYKYQLLCYWFKVKNAISFKSNKHLEGGDTKGKHKSLGWNHIFKCSLKDLSHIFDRPCHYYICTVVFWCQQYSMLFIYGNLLFPTKQYLKYSWTKTPFSIII